MVNNLCTNNPLLILTWNANELNNHSNELLTTLQKNKVDIAFISETHFIDTSTKSFLGFLLFYTIHPNGTAHVVTLIIIRSTLLLNSLL